MKVLVACTAFLLGLSVNAQKIENLKATFANGNVIINYDLAGGNHMGKYNVDIYSSHNGYLNPLNFVAGDVGKNVSGGANKEILWEAGKELGTFKGELTFKVKAEVLPLPYSFISPVASGSIRRGKSTNVQWEGGIAEQNVTLEVYRGSDRVAAIADTKNTGEYSWIVPQEFEKGTDYTLRISDGKVAATSASFAVKAKIPLLLKLSPLLIGAAIIPFLGGNGGGTETPPVNEKLAAPPNPN